MIALFPDPGIVLVLVASKQHIAVRSADDDAHFIRKATVFGVCIERFDVHGGSVGLQKVLRKEERFAFFDGDVGKEIPRRNAEKAGQFVNCKNRSPSSLPRQDDAPALQKLDEIALPTKFPAFIAEIFDGISCECVYSGVFAEDADEEYGILRLLREIGAAAADAIEIAAEILCCNADGEGAFFCR